MAVRLHFLAAADSVFSRREKEMRKVVFAVGQEMETDFLQALADRFVASIAEVGSSLETVCRSSDLSHFATADLAIAAADSVDFADFAGSFGSADSFGFAGSFRSAGSARIGPHRLLRSSLFSAAVEAEGSASALGSASAS